MRFALAIAFLLTALTGSVAQEVVTAGQLLEKGFEVRASFTIDKGSSVLVLEKAAEVFLCELVGAEALTFALAPMAVFAGKEMKPLPSIKTACAQIK